MRTGTGIADRALDSYGAFVSDLARWTHFITLTHDPRRLAEVSSSWTRIGIASHRSRVGHFIRDARRLDPGCAWWSEMELHASGQPHEHGLLAASENAPILSIRQAWFDRSGYARVEVIRDPRDVAAYIAKYGGKVGAYPPRVAGLGLIARESFAQVLPR